MLSFLKKIFGAKPAESTAAPYKVETPKAETTPATKAKKPAAKKPRAPKKPKA